MKRIVPAVLLGIIAVTAVVYSVRRPPPPTPVERPTLRSYFTDTRLYDEAFASASGSVATPVLAAVTSHHFLARDLIAKTFASIDGNRKKRIIIVSPDHFRQIEEKNVLIETTASPWTTPFGDMAADRDMIADLTHSPQVTETAMPFAIEHGIYTLVPFAARALPGIRIVPLILRQTNDYQAFYRLGKETARIANPDDSVLVMSSDFSHQAARDTAESNDTRSVTLLRTKRLEDVPDIENDCRQCTAFLFGYLGTTDADMTVLFRGDSFQISAERPDSVTSYVGVFYSKPVR